MAGDGGIVALERAAVATTPRYNGMVGTVMTIIRQEGPKYVVELLCLTEMSTPWRVDRTVMLRCSYHSCYLTGVYTTVW